MKDSQRILKRYEKESAWLFKGVVTNSLSGCFKSLLEIKFGLGYVQNSIKLYGQPSMENVMFVISRKTF